MLLGLQDIVQLSVLLVQHPLLRLEPLQQLLLVVRPRYLSIENANLLIVVADLPVKQGGILMQLPKLFRPKRVIPEFGPLVIHNMRHLAAILALVVY